MLGHRNREMTRNIDKAIGFKLTPRNMEPCGAYDTKNNFPKMSEY